MFPLPKKTEEKIVTKCKAEITMEKRKLIL